MNRETLFRGKRKDNDEWVYGSLISYPNNVYEILKIEMGRCCLSTEHFKIIPETIGQYTGLTDKNGKKIFEGDVLKSYYDKPGVVKWNNEIGAFQIKGIPSQTMKRCYQMEVIGNIYESKINK